MPRRSLVLTLDNGIVRDSGQGGAGPAGPQGPQGVPGSNLVFATALLASSSRLVDFDTTGLADGTEASVSSFDCTFIFNAASTAAPDGVTIFAPVVGPGRWFRLLDLSSRWTTQASWFIDVAGDDENDGATVVTPLQTVEELNRRISGGTINQNTVATLGAGTFGRPSLDLQIPAGVVFTIQGDVSTTATGTLSAVTAQVPATNTRLALTNTGGDPAFVVRTRVRLTSGANIGALGWVTRLIAASNVNTSAFATIDPAVQTNPSIIAPAVGNTYAIDALNTALGRCELRCRGPGRILVRECNVSISGSSEAHRIANDQGTLAGVRFYSCIFGGFSALFYQGQGSFVSCLFQPTVTTVFNQAYMVIRACVFANQSVFGLLLDGAATLDAGFANCFSNCPMHVNASQVNFVGSSGQCEFSDRTDYAIWCYPKGTIVTDSGSVLWGNNNTIGAASAAVVVQALSPGIALAVIAQLHIPGAVNDTRIGGTNTAYGALPFYNTARGCGIVLKV